MKKYKTYIKIMRLDHWIKQLFILPGTVFAWVLLHPVPDRALLLRFLFGFLSTCLIASANYVINEWLDAEFDRYHPVKKHRSIVENGASPKIVYTLYGVLTVLGLAAALGSSRYVFYMELWLWVMGVLYNVKPIRTKDVVFLDVLSESVNNAIRLLIGWFIVTSSFYPPISLIIGYWMGGAFLMATKRFAEYRMIDDPKTAALYRRSFKYYTAKSLLLSAFFYAICSVFFTGIFLIKYRIELLLMMPFLIGLFCYYFLIAFKDDSAVQKPEKLFKEKWLMGYVTFLCVLFAILMVVDIPGLSSLLEIELISTK